MSGGALPAARWWHAALLVGFGAILVGLWLGQSFPQQSFAADPGYGAPVLALEFAGGQDDLIAVFGPDHDPRQIERLAAMRTGNERDYLFMLFYAAFLACGLTALGRETGRRAIGFAAALPVLAALCDGYENWLLFDIQTAFTAGDYSPAMASLPYPVAAKFLLLALANVAIGLALARIGPRWTLAGTLVIVASVPTVMALTAPESFGWTLPAAIGGGWIALLGVAAIASWRALMRGAPLVAAPAPVRSAQPAPVAAAPAPRKAFGRRKP